jgi:hypothetical protein
MTRHITVQLGNNHQHTKNTQTIYTTNNTKQNIKTIGETYYDMDGKYDVMWKANGTRIVPIHVYVESCAPVPHYANWIDMLINLHIIEEVDLVLDETGNGKIVNVVGYYTNKESTLAREGSIVVGHVSATNYSGSTDVVVCGVVDGKVLGKYFGKCEYFPFISISICGIEYIDCPGEYEVIKFANEFLTTSNIRIKPQTHEQLVHTLLALYIINKLQHQ